MTWFAPLARRESVSGTRGHRFSLVGQVGFSCGLTTYCKLLYDFVLGFTSSWHRPCLYHRIMQPSAVLLVAFAVLASPSLASAQGKRSRDTKAGDFPANMRPPAGMCRVWLDDVPPAQQPAVTDCTTAVRNRPAKGRVIFGDDYAKTKTRDTSSKAPAIKGFAPSGKKPKFP